MLTINPAAPAIARAAITVQAPPDVVFATLAAIEDWPDWQESVSRVEVDGAPGLGLRFRWKSGSWITSTIEMFQAPQAIGWRGHAIGTHAIHIWRLTPDGGGTRVETEESMQGWLVSLLPGPMGKLLDRGVHAALRALKDESERRLAAARFAHPAPAVAQAQGEMR